ncbi:MAG: 30S ribosomal protein S17e [Sulfolobaceae archaeon]|uniref:30S ribosomal protein S17e n=1 Tax=unclassified Stygiolobus TaxID=2824672 RepID=UPI000D577832|nr:30S ribosomal protein S17e [Sulfolobaceae archaeon]PVU75984.1 30S ribosomal protein S17e [Sulfolobus sp. SCGC AB-777_G06]
MGNVYTKDIKRVAQELYEKFKDQVTADFYSNKKLVDMYIDVQSKKVKNRIAGYLTRFAKLSKEQATKEVAEEESEE